MKPTREAIITRAWGEVERVFEKNDLCQGCEHHDGFEGDFMEPPQNVCKLLDTDGTSPFSCPSVTLKDVEETMAAEAEEAAEARVEWIREERLLRSQGD